MCKVLIPMNIFDFINLIFDFLESKFEGGRRRPGLPPRSARLSCAKIPLTHFDNKKAQGPSPFSQIRPHHFAQIPLTHFEKITWCVPRCMPDAFPMHTRCRPRRTPRGSDHVYAADMSAHAHCVLVHRLPVQPPPLSANTCPKPLMYKEISLHKEILRNVRTCFHI